MLPLRITNLNSSDSTKIWWHPPPHPSEIPFCPGRWGGVVCNFSLDTFFDIRNAHQDPQGWRAQAWFMRCAAVLNSFDRAFFMPSAHAIGEPVWEPASWCCNTRCLGDSIRSMYNNLKERNLKNPCHLHEWKAPENRKKTKNRRDWEK